MHKITSLLRWISDPNGEIKATYLHLSPDSSAMRHEIQNTSGLFIIAVDSPQKSCVDLGCPTEVIE